MLFGVVNVFKPPRLTSRDVVDRVLRCCPRKTKVGHAGTLDPMATGVLVVAVGPATRLIQYAQVSGKSYTASFRLGYCSDTEDITGNVESIPDSPTVSEIDLVGTLGQFEGTIQQTPPMYSAIKVKGQRAYKAARKGVALEIAPRPIVVHSIQLLEFDFPEFTVAIDCGKGTYVRTLGRDIAKSLGSDCVMTALQRTAVGEFAIESSVKLEEIEDQGIETSLLDPVSMVDSLPRIQTTSSQVQDLRHGKRLSSDTWNIADSVEELAAVDQTQQLLAILQRKSPNEFGPKINFAPQLFG